MGKPGGRSAGTPMRDLRANAYLLASLPHLPQAGRSSRKRSAGAPRPCLDPDNSPGARTLSDLAALQAERPRIARPGGSTRLLLSLCPASSPVLVARPRVANSPGRATGGSRVEVVSFIPTAPFPPKTL